MKPAMRMFRGTQSIMGLLACNKTLSTRLRLLLLLLLLFLLLLLRRRRRRRRRRLLHFLHPEFFLSFLLKYFFLSPF